MIRSSSSGSVLCFVRQRADDIQTLLRSSSKTNKFFFSSLTTMIFCCQRKGKMALWATTALIMLQTILLVSRAVAFLPLSRPGTVLSSTTSPPVLMSFSSSSSSPRRSTSLTHLHMSGRGVAPSYTWYEEAFELEVTVKVPKDTRAKDIRFKATSNSIDLRLDNGASTKEEVEQQILLDPERPLRGNVVVDGTFWAISDPEDVGSSKDDEKSNEELYREVTVTIEKQIRTPVDDFDVINYDWGGVYKKDDEEVTFRKYDEPEELDVREYAASLGVDIDNIDMNLVDKSMFSSGLNVTKSSFDSLKDAGLMTETTQQADGSEWTTNEEGQRIQFSSMGDGISKDEAFTASRRDADDNAAPRPKIPFLDTDSPWSKTVPVDKANEIGRKAASRAADSFEEGAPALKEQRGRAGVDPILELTVAKLRDVLRSRGLKVSGSKKELQDRLRNEVQSMLKGSDGPLEETN